MISTESFPTSTSLLLLPTASLNLSTTLSSLRRSALSTSNRLQSIQQDSIFVQDVASQHGLPLIANERCGSWYVEPTRKAGSAYFKSTDGHFGQWSFSKRRLNLQVLDVVGKHGGWVRGLISFIYARGVSMGGLMVPLLQMHNCRLYTPW